MRIVDVIDDHSSDVIAGINATNLGELCSLNADDEPDPDALRQFVRKRLDTSDLSPDDPRLVSLLEPFQGHFHGHGFARLRKALEAREDGPDEAKTLLSFPKTGDGRTRSSLPGSWLLVLTQVRTRKRESKRRFSLLNSTGSRSKTKSTPEKSRHGPNASDRETLIS